MCIKKIFWALLLCVAIVSPARAADGRELVVYAAASLSETLGEIGRAFEASRDGVSVVFSFDSSGALKRQIEEGAACDVFISAGQKQMNELSSVAPETRFDILENKVALVVPQSGTDGITSYADLAERLRAGTVMLAMGGADVPVGQYAQRILAWAKLDEADLAKRGVLSYGSNVKEVASQVAEAAVDCGIVYATDAASAGLVVVDTATEEMCGRVVYPAAVIATSKQRELADDFLAFITSPEARPVFEAVGFTPLR